MGYHHNSAAAKDVLDATGAMARKRRQVFHAIVDLFMQLPEETALQTGVCPDQVAAYTGMTQNSVSTLFTDLKEEHKIIFVRDAKNPNSRFTVGWYRPEFNQDLWLDVPDKDSKGLPAYYGVDLLTGTLHGGYKTPHQRNNALSELVGPEGRYVKLRRMRNGIVLED